MKKVFIEDSRVQSFLSDLSKRLRASLCSESNADVSSLIIVGVGESGTLVAEKLMPLLSDKASPFDKALTAISVQRTDEGNLMAVSGNGTISELSAYLATVGDDTAFLLVDGVCRSGQTLTLIYNELRRASKRVWTYAVAVSADSIFIPTWYGCLCESHEYVMLIRQGMTPNTALFTNRPNGGEHNFETPALVLRPPIDGDPEFEAGKDAESINRYTSDDRFFDSTTKAKHILVLEWNSVPVGFVAFHVESRTLWIDYIVACKSDLHKDKKGIGSALYYHVENYAKLRGCENISLWAISSMIDWYGKRGFSKVPGKPISIGKDKKESYHPMTHRLVSDAGHYHV